MIFWFLGNDTSLLILHINWGNNRTTTAKSIYNCNIFLFLAICDSKKKFQTCQLFENDDFMGRIVVVYCLRQEVKKMTMKIEIVGLEKSLKCARWNFMHLAFELRSSNEWILGSRIWAYMFYYNSLIFVCVFCYSFYWHFYLYYLYSTFAFLLTFNYIYHLQVFFVKLIFHKRYM